LRHQAGIGWQHGYPRHFIAALTGMFILCILVWRATINKETGEIDVPVAQ
jgi:hypothetical protein